MWETTNLKTTSRVALLWLGSMFSFVPKQSRSKCESALLERLQLATEVALQAGAAMKLVINTKKEGIVHKGATDL